MKLTYTMAQIMALSALIPTWVPTINGWGLTDPRAFVCWTVALVLIGTPYGWERYGPGLELGR